VPQALVAADLDLASNVRCDLTTEVTLDLEVAFEEVAELDEIVVGQVANPGVRADTGRRQRLLRAGTPHAEDVGECHLDALLAREVDTD